MKLFNLPILAVVFALACDANSTPQDQTSGYSSASPVSAPAAGSVSEKMGVMRDEAAQNAFSGQASAPRTSARLESPGSNEAVKQGPIGDAAAPSMMIRTGQAFIEVEKVDPAILKIRQLVAQVGGYIANSSVSGGHDQIRQATIELKIPSAKYDEAVTGLSSIGKLETVTTSAQDVGEEFVDVTARVENARRLEQRLLSLLATRTGKLEEVLSVERELARVREEIERYEGRLRYLSSRVSMSTLTITVHEPTPILGSAPGENPIAAALRRAWRNFVALLAGLIASLGVVIPLALIAAGGYYAYRRWILPRNKKS